MIPRSSCESRDHGRRGPCRSTWMNALFGAFESRSSTSSDDENVDATSVHMSPWDLFDPLYGARGHHSSNSRCSDKGSLEKALAVRDDLSKYGFLYGEQLELEEDEDATELWDFEEDDDDFSWAPERNLKVTFNTEVLVKEIPSHQDYCDELKDVIWNSTKAINMSAARNKFEFVADGGDWRTASEEDTFAYLPSGELVHPATWMRTAPLYQPRYPPQEFYTQRNKYVSKYMKGEKTNRKFAQVMDQAPNLIAKEQSMQNNMHMPAVLLLTSSRKR